VSFDGMKECCDVLYHNYVDPDSIYQILPQIQPDPDTLHLAVSNPDPTNSPDIRPDPDMDLVHPYHQAIIS